MTRPADLVNQVVERKAMCLSAFRGQAAIKQTLPAGFLGSRVLDPGEGAWSPRLLAPCHHDPRGVDKVGYRCIRGEL